MQEAFLRVLAHPRLEQMEISISYLLRVVHNLLRRRYARLTRLREIIEMDVIPTATRRDRDRARADTEDEWSVSVDHDLLEKAMSHLSADERSSIRFIVCEGRSYAEAARSLGVSITTINNWKHRGLRKLRQAMIREEITAKKKFGRKVKSRIGKLTTEFLLLNGTIQKSVPVKRFRLSFRVEAITEAVQVATWSHRLDASSTKRG